MNVGNTILWAGEAGQNKKGEMKKVREYWCSLFLHILVDHEVSTSLLLSPAALMQTELSCLTCTIRTLENCRPIDPPVSALHQVFQLRQQ